MVVNGLLQMDVGRIVEYGTATGNGANSDGGRSKTSAKGMMDWAMTHNHGNELKRTWFVIAHGKLYMGNG